MIYHFTDCRTSGVGFWVVASNMENANCFVAELGRVAFSDRLYKDFAERDSAEAEPYAETVYFTS